jgi:hypothetical protein
MNVNFGMRVCLGVLLAAGFGVGAAGQTLAADQVHDEIQVCNAEFFAPFLLRARVGTGGFLRSFIHHESEN